MAGCSADGIHRRGSDYAERQSIACLSLWNSDLVMTSCFGWEGQLTFRSCHSLSPLSRLVRVLGALSMVLMARAEQETAVPMCSLMASLRTYAGKVVTVSGEFEAGPEQFFAGGRQCKQPFVTAGFTWPTALQVRFVGGPDTPATVPFEADDSNVLAFRQAVANMKKKTGGIRACVSITGLVQLRDDYHVSVRPDGRITAMGFGHMGAFPGQLIVKSVLVKSWVEDGSARSCM